MNERLELSDFIAALSADLAKARRESSTQSDENRFGLNLGSVQVEVFVMTERKTKQRGEFSAKFYVVGVGGGASGESTSQETQRITLHLFPSDPDSAGVGM